MRKETGEMAEKAEYGRVERGAFTYLTCEAIIQYPLSTTLTAKNAIGDLLLGLPLRGRMLAANPT